MGLLSPAEIKGLFANAPEPWQSRYALPDWKDRLTALSPDQEQEFKAWAGQNAAPVTDDYDMRGFWLNGGSTAFNQNDGAVHYPDTYKTPYHQSFSGESVFADPASGPPTWNDRDQLIASDGRILFDERRPR